MMRMSKVQEIRDNIFPCQLHTAEFFRGAFPEKEGAQPAFAKRTGPAEIVTVHAMPREQPEFQEKNKKYIPDDQDDAELQQDYCANDADEERQKI